MGSGAAEILDIAKDSGHLGTRRSAEVEEEGKIEKKRGIRFVVGRRGTTQRCQCHGSQKTASHPIGSAGTPRPNITPVTVRAKKRMQEWNHASHLVDATATFVFTHRGTRRQRGLTRRREHLGEDFAA